ncbi:Homeobox-leucine zipper protein HOX32 [Hibiscus syriacus]|uniref:Homeobox-leucine zipper protein HOX32 n=1 Tax=Hibiscus syriacus TaxID=106335 RepID=A0A6A2YUU0_HIBSY|nr:Homeobox-leucine zipper protein HOX32 [Hibiscus syriacus]
MSLSDEGRGGSPGGESLPNEPLNNKQTDSSKYVSYTPEQVEALERVYNECPKPSSLRRQQLIRECHILSNIEPKQIKKQVSHLIYENGYMKQQLQTTSATTTDNNSCESVVVSGQHQQQQNPTPQHPQRDANNPAGVPFESYGTAVDWVQMIGMKVAKILKDRPSWFRDCRCVDILSIIPTANGGTIELIYMQVHLCAYNIGCRTGLLDSEIYYELRRWQSRICERSLTSSTGGPTGPPTSSFVRAEMLPSGFLIRPCEGGGSIVHIVDHVDLDVWSVPEVIRPLYESSKILAQKMTIAALRHIRQIAQETNGEIQYGSGCQPAVLRTFSQRLYSDGIEDVTIMVKSYPGKFLGSQYNASMVPSFGGGVLCAKASMLLQNVPPALLVRFLREHRSEWADYGLDTYSATSLKPNLYTVPCARPSGFPIPRSCSSRRSCVPEDVTLARDMYLLQLCSGIDENTVGACAELVFADNAPLLPSGFRVIPLDPKTVMDGLGATRTLDLASTLEEGPGSNRLVGDGEQNNYNLRSVLTIAFQFTFENHLRDEVASMARQYLRSIVGLVQRVAMAIAPSRVNSGLEPKTLPGSLEALTLVRLICRSYRIHTGGELLRADSQADDALLKQLTQGFVFEASPVFTFANRAGLDMLETTLVALQVIMLDKILDEAGRKILCSEFSKIMQQGYDYQAWEGRCHTSRPLLGRLSTTTTRMPRITA